ncbi:MAG TPA: Gfo/Idh/MocA family oxidoreductase [Dictyobacter sp.]|jgi:predicted dehydrogenase|nr:Gfo/Idh/MocA family oxidoreductase [Dictyobacter sp.]
MTVKIVHVGLGGWGSNWAENIVAKNKDIETTAWVEIDARTLKTVGERLKLPEERCFTSLDEALATVEADAVLVTANLPGHVPCAQTALHAGKHVLMEKPFAPTIAEAQQLVELADEQGKILMISQNYRFAPAVRTVIKLMQEQVIGRIGMVNIDFRRYDNIAPVESHLHYHIWEPLLVDMAIHHFDLMRCVIGQEPQKVIGQTWNDTWSRYDEPASGALTIFFDGGAVVSYRGSWTSTAPQTNWAGEWSMEGEKGVMVWTSRGELPDSVVVRLHGKEPKKITMPKMAQIDRAGSLAAFAAAVQQGTQPETTGRDNLRTLSLMFAAIEAAKTEHPVLIEM